MARSVEIYCPKCSWSPAEGDRWGCGCGCFWNTFDTCGICPQCGRKWEQTQCGECERWSPHAEWYHQFGSDGPTRKETVPNKRPEPVEAE